MLQRITLVGNLGSDPELRYLPDGRPVCNFSMATNRKWTNKDGSEVEEVVWWKISVFGNQAEPCAQYLSKGRQVLVEGRMKPNVAGYPRIWRRQDGSSAASYELTATSVQFLGKGTDAAPGQTQAAQQYSAEKEIDAEGIPF